MEVYIDTIHLIEQNIFEFFLVFSRIVFLVFLCMQTEW